jgi:hypothetical protein
MKLLVLVFIGMMSAFLAESCPGNPTRGQLSAIKTAKSTFEVHLVWTIFTSLLRQEDRCELLCVRPCASATATAQERGSYAAMHKYCHSNFPPVNKIVMCRRCQSAVKWVTYFVAALNLHSACRIISAVGYGTKRWCLPSGIFCFHARAPPNWIMAYSHFIRSERNANALSQSAESWRHTVLCCVTEMPWLGHHAAGSRPTQFTIPCLLQYQYGGSAIFWSEA